MREIQPGIDLVFQSSKRSEVGKWRMGGIESHNCHRITEVLPASGRDVVSEDSIPLVERFQLIDEEDIALWTEVETNPRKLNDGGGLECKVARL